MLSVYMPVRLAAAVALDIKKIAKKHKIKVSWLLRYLIEQSLSTLSIENLKEAASRDVTSGVQRKGQS